MVLVRQALLAEVVMGLRSGAAATEARVCTVSAAPSPVIAEHFS